MNEFKKIESRNFKWWMINGTIKKKDFKLFSISSTSSSPTFSTISIFRPFQIVQRILFHPLSNFPKVLKAFYASWHTKTINAPNINKWKYLSTSYGTFINPLNRSVLNPLHPKVQSLDIKGSLTYHTIGHIQIIWKLPFLSSTLSLKDIPTGTMRILCFEGHLHWQNEHLVL